MAQKAVDMNQIKQVKQLKQDGVPIKEIARRTEHQCDRQLTMHRKWQLKM